MWNATAVLVCALDILGRSAASFPPIFLLSERPPDVSHIAEAFTREGTLAIFVLTSSNTFQSIQRANYRCGDLDAVRKLASILVHEEHHVQHGPSEREAYQAQLATLVRLGAPPGSPTFTAVVRSMRVVLATRPTTFAK